MSAGSASSSVVPTGGTACPEEDAGLESDASPDAGRVAMTTGGTDVPALLSAVAPPEQPVRTTAPATPTPMSDRRRGRGTVRP